MRYSIRLGWLAGLVALVVGSTVSAAEPTTLLNASYDVSRELFTQINPGAGRS
jgi:ABC-type sulfate transport system substrate-binding protein